VSKVMMGDSFLTGSGGSSGLGLGLVDLISGTSSPQNAQNLALSARFLPQLLQYIMSWPESFVI
jgi:hypothetical protein